MVWYERRSSDRHLIELPIKYRVIDDPRNKQVAVRGRTKNVSDNGLLFLSSENFEIGTTLELTFPVKNQIFTMQGKVVRVEHDSGSDLHKIGIQFQRSDHVFQVKMAEQIHQIAQYQRQLSEQEGRIVSEEEAAHKWIEAHSGDFAEFFKK